MERFVKILSFETVSEDDYEEYKDEWQVVSPSLHGMLSCVLTVAHVRCHDHLCIRDHLEATRDLASSRGDASEIRSIDRRLRQSRAYARSAVRVFATDAAEDLGARDVARKILLFTFPDGMHKIASLADTWSQTALQYVAPPAHRILPKLTASPVLAGMLPQMLQTVLNPLPQKQADEPVAATADIEAALDAIEAQEATETSSETELETKSKKSRKK